MNYFQKNHDPDVTSKSGFTPLHIAAHYGNENIAKLLHAKGADVNFAAKHNITPLHVASKWGKVSMVSMLIAAGATLDSKTRDGLTPLHCAARSGHDQVVDLLLEHGAPMRSKTKNGLAPLHMASQGDHVDAARILLYHKAPVDEVTVDYLTALHVAAHCGHLRVTKLLLDRKADADARALNGFTPLHIACKKNRIKVVELLLKHGASIEATTESGLTPLHVASFMGCMNIVIFLLQHNAAPDIPTIRGETPLHLAARANQTDIIRILLRNNALVDAKAREEQTPLHVASRLGNTDIVMLLLQHGAAIDAPTKDLYTPLHIAAKEGQDEVAGVLIEHGASLNATTKKGFTPLHLAAKYGNIKVAKQLLQKDVDVDAQGKNGVTPLHVASHYDHQNVALLLLDKGASPHATAKNGHTSLHIAARKNQIDIASTLLEYGTKANAESKAGFTALHLAAQEGHVDMSVLLLDHGADPNHQSKNGLVPLHLCAQEDKVDVAKILVKRGATVDAMTKGGYTPLHVASHFGQLNMVRYLLGQGANVNSSTSIGYTPLHQAAQQGHVLVITLLLENKAKPNSVTQSGQTPLSIAQKLGYISVIETLKVVTETTITTTTTTTIEEKYKVVAPEAMHETFMSDSEDEGGEDNNVDQHNYSYLMGDEMKGFGDDSHRIDVTRDEENRAPLQMREAVAMQENYRESYTSPQSTRMDNVNIKRAVHAGFLVSFLVDARGGAMRGCRHSGVRVIVPPRKAPMPMRITCRYLKRDKLLHPPPLMEGEALASKVLELGPVGAKFLGPVIIEVPHFASLRGKEREIVICRSDNGETWKEHTLEASHEAVQDVLNESFEGEELGQIEDLHTNRITRILTEDFPQYFAIITRLRQEVHPIGPEGGTVSSCVVPQVQAVFPPNALTKKIRVGLQAQPIPAELAAKLLGNRVAISPIVTVEPRRRKFHKPITLTIPIPQAASKGMINQYSGEAPTLRLLCSITGGSTRAQWEDVTGSTPLTFVKDCVSFTTTVSARFWLMDCRNIGEATKMATELYREAVHVPFMAKFVVFAKRIDVLEARLRVFCMTDDKEDKTLEHQENFTEVAKSRDVEVLEGKANYVEFGGNLIPITKSGDQLQFTFRAFKENRLPFNVRIRDQHDEAMGRIFLMKDPKVAKGDPSQSPICVLQMALPENILPDIKSEPDLLNIDRFRGGSLNTETIHRADIRLSDISNRLHRDWILLAKELNISPENIKEIEEECPNNIPQQAMLMLRLWLHMNGNRPCDKYKKKILKEKPTCSSDPCQTVPVLPDTTPPEEEPCESESPAVVKKACEPCEPCPPAESDHPVLKPQCDIPLPLVLCIKYFEEPCPQKPVVFPPELPCPYGIAIDMPIGRFLEEKGFCPELIHPISMNEVVYPDETALLKRKLKIRLPGQEMKLEKIINSPENYRTERIAYIYKFPKNVMQSGTYNTRFWHVKYNVQQSWENPTMGWMSTGDSHAALVLDFGNSDQAIAFCKKNNIKWQLLSPPRNILSHGLRAINREDIVNACIYNVEPVSDATEKELAKRQLDDSFKFDNSACDSLQLDQSGFDSLKDELGPSRDSSLGRGSKLDPSFKKMEDKITKDKTEKEKMAKEIGKDETQDDLSNGMQAVLDQRLHENHKSNSLLKEEHPIRDISDHLEIIHAEKTGKGNGNQEHKVRESGIIKTEESSHRHLSDENSQPDEATGELSYPEILDPTKKITKSKAKKSKSKGKSSSGGQNFTDKKEIEWDFDDAASDKVQKKRNDLRKQAVQDFIGHEAAGERLKDSNRGNSKKRDGVESDSDSDSRDSAVKRQQLNSPGKRTIASSSGSDVALHEGAELSPDDNTGLGANSAAFKINATLTRHITAYQQAYLSIFNLNSLYYQYNQYNQ
ncbi:hypothetical protein RUM43_001490 [Polyplax serrata]|uniref:NADH dehydrogenase [ubiquinone] iron-sulfur protein 4, mitochondrial n=1 Tax=Polyplax serrata TaxID=468196 RepID=A0AAN8SFG9_POLSC